MKPLVLLHILFAWMVATNNLPIILRKVPSPPYDPSLGFFSPVVEATLAAYAAAVLGLCFSAAGKFSVYATPDNRAATTADPFATSCEAWAGSCDSPLKAED